MPRRILHEGVAGLLLKGESLGSRRRQLQGRCGRAEDDPAGFVAAVRLEHAAVESKPLVRRQISARDLSRDGVPGIVPVRVGLRELEKGLGLGARLQVLKAEIVRDFA